MCVHRANRPLATIGLAIAAAASGCQTLWTPNPSATEANGAAVAKAEKRSLNPLDWGAEKDKPREGEPSRIVATWTDTVRHAPGEPAERGFGGRLYFYDRGADPIAVDGRLVVYAFDESGREPTDHKPTRRYVFPAEQFGNHLSQSEIGASYSVWLPWGGVGGPSTDISLIARFEPAGGGGLVVSDQATQRLPGRDVGAPPGEGVMIAGKPAPPVQQAGFQSPPPRAGQPAASATAEAPPAPKRRLTTTTINLSR